MRKVACQCRCGNIKVKGDQLPPGSYPNLPATERANISQCRVFLTISKQSISIQNFAQISSRIINSFCTEVICKQCSTFFRFFTSRSVFYCGLVGASAPRPNQRHQTLIVHHPSNSNPENQSFPHQLRQFLANEARPRSQTTHSIDQEQINQNEDTNFPLGNDGNQLSLDNSRNTEDSMISNEDIDFSMMFSSNADPIVGSYKTHITIPQDRPIPQANQDWGPKSYFI